MKIYRNIIGVATLLSGLTLCHSCSECGSTQHATPEEVEAAQTLARTLAMELQPMDKPDTMAMESILIDIRERERRLRTHGHDDVADELIETFLSTLDSVNPSLANELSSCQ